MNTPVQKWLYNDDTLKQLEQPDLKTMFDFSDAEKQHWINLHSVADTEYITQITDKLGVERIAYRTIIGELNRTKLVDLDHQLFFSAISILSYKQEVTTERISFLLMDNVLFSFQEQVSDHFDEVRTRLTMNLGIIRKRKVDYLLYWLLDAILEPYFEAIEHLENRLEKLQDNFDFDNLHPNSVFKLEKLKIQLAKVKDAAEPLQKALSGLQKRKVQLIDDRHLPYFDDLKDQLDEITQKCESLERRIESTINFYFSLQGHKMNQVMKTLTVVSAVFIPLTFIVGIYGMNFESMPELKLAWAYPMVWVLMVSVVIALVIYFKRKNWF